MRALTSTLALTFALALPAQTPPDAPVRPAGSPCEQGTAPAATLLVPYFEVDSASDVGLDTLVGITNVDDDPLVAHMVVWNVDAWSVFSFNIYLTGYDIATFSMRDILIHGRLPNNGCATAASRFTTRYIDCNGDGAYFGQEWTRNDGMFSSPFGAYDIACYEPVPPAVLADWQCKLSIGSYDGWNDDFVGYLTVDHALTCGYGLPDALPVPYFRTDYLDTDGDGVRDHGVLENGNVLMGDILYYDHDAMRSDGVPAVHIEAWGEQNALAGHSWGSRPSDWADDGVSTFYYKYEYIAGFPLHDAREPLPLRWSFRHIGNASFDGGTTVDVWRSHNPLIDHWYIQGGPCAWYDAGGSAYTVLYNPNSGYLGYARPIIETWDEDGNKAQSGGGPCTPPPVTGFDLLFLATQRVEVETPDWPLVDESGWMTLEFDTDRFCCGTGLGNAFDQSWVTVRYSALNRYSAAINPASILGGCAFDRDDDTGAYSLKPTH